MAIGMAVRASKKSISVVTNIVYASTFATRDVSEFFLRSS